LIGHYKRIIILYMARRTRLTKIDPEFLGAVSDALQAYKRSRTSAGEKCTNASLAVDLGIDESTVAKYIRKEAPIMAEALARACVDLGISFRYRGHTISSGAFPITQPGPAQPAAQLEFLFDAGYSAEEDSWRMTQRRAEPMEFTLRIKIAS
jgi:transcriptional regulator with XRE-family HTH domain